MTVGFIARVQKTGKNQLGVYLPKRVRDAMDISAGDEVEFIPRDGDVGTFKVIRGRKS